MSWFWMNVPLALAFFAAWCGIPLYMVLRHPNWTTEPADSDECAAKPQRAAQAHREALPSATLADSVS